MGANQALESAATFVNILRPVMSQKQDRLSEGSIPQSEVENCLAQYDVRRRARVTTAFRIANLTCQAQLKIGPASEEYCLNLPRMMSEAGIANLLESFCNAEMLENWPTGGPQVAVYTAFAGANWRVSRP